MINSKFASGFLLASLLAFGEAWGGESGLRAQVAGPVNCSLYAPTTMQQFTACETQEFANISIDATQSVYKDNVKRASVVSWYGTLVVPESANYTFCVSVQTWEGAHLVVNGQTLVDKNFIGTTSPSLATTDPIYLEAGEYPIALDYISYSTSLKCSLSWSNDKSITESVVIPSAQFKPVANEKFPVYRSGDLNAAWCGRSASGKFFYPQQVDADSFMLNGGPQYYSNGWISRVLGRFIDSSFRAEITYDMTDASASSNYGAYLFVNSSTNTGTFLTYSMRRTSASEILSVVQASLTQGESSGQSGASVDSGSSGSSKFRLRLERDPLGRIGCYSRELPDGDWQLNFMYDRDGKWVKGRVEKAAAIATFPDSVFVGFGVMNEALAQVDDVAYSHPLFAPLSFAAVGDTEAPGATLTWSNAANQTSFKVLYRSLGSDNWITAAEGLSAATESYRLTTGLSMYVTYEAKIVAVGTDGEAESEVKTFTCGLTGLNGVVVGPVESGSYNRTVKNQCLVRETRHFAEPYLNVAKTVSLFETTNLVNGVVCWRGSLNVPAAGTYTFKVLCNDEGNASCQGARLQIDDTVLVDKRIFADADTSMSGAMELTAGLHPIVIDFGSFNAGQTVKHFEIQWLKPGAEGYERIPAVNFRPTVAINALPDFACDGHEFRFPAKESRLKFTTVEKTSDGAYELLGGGVSGYGFGGYVRAIFGNVIEGPFEATFSLNWANVPAAAAGNSPAIGIAILRNSSAGDNLEFGLCHGSNPGCGLCLYGSDKPGAITAGARYGFLKLEPTDWIRFKIKRTKEKRFVCKYATRSEDGNWSHWTTQFVYDGDSYNGTKYGDLTDDELFVGVFSAMVEPQKVYEFSITKPKGLTLLVR